MKTCSICNEEKSLSEFHKDSRGKSGVRSECKICSNKNKKIRYQNDPESQTKNNIKTDKLRKRNRIFVYNFLLRSKCIDCGDARWQVLDFDHVREEKYDNISNMVHSGCSISRIETEISKCEIRCSNCHRMKTSEQLNYYPYLKDYHHNPA